MTQRPKETKWRGAARAAVGRFVIALSIAGAGQACAQSTPAPTPSVIFATAYHEVQDYYLEAVPLETLSLAAIDAFDETGGFVARDDGSAIALEEQGREVRRLKLPPPGDAAAWASMTAEALALARDRSVAVRALSDEEIYARAFAGMIRKLDRFTRYAGGEQARLQRDTRDGFGGIGVSLDYQGPLPRVSALNPDSPALRAGLRVDDRLTAIDDVPTAGLAPEQMIARLHGPIGSLVRLTVDRAGSARPIVLTTARALIVPASVTLRFEDDIAIVRLTVFNARTAAELAQALRTVGDRRPAVEGFVLDLRGNPGGLLDQAASVASLFLDHGIVVTTRGRNPAATQQFSGSGEDRLHGLPMVVLVNGDSASSAEIVAAALQDSHRARLVGSASFGKGTVQMLLPLDNGGELTLTWARIYTPSGYLLHEHGVVPTFCTSSPMTHRADGGTALPEAERVRRVVEDGLHPTRPESLGDRAILDQAGWLKLRADCPPTIQDEPLDLEVAHALLHQAIPLPAGRPQSAMRRQHRPRRTPAAKPAFP